MALLALVIGLALYIWAVRSQTSYFYSTNVISWLLVALFPVLLLFSMFPGSTISGTLAGFSMSGAIAAFIFIWWYGTKAATDARTIDDVRNNLLAKLKEQEDELELLKDNQRKNQRSPLPIREHKILPYRLKQAQRKRIGLITGGIESVREADIWVNSENTNMQMSRYLESSISGVIRYLGAKKDTAGYITEDTIADALKQAMGSNRVVAPATVLVTASGELQGTHNVKKIFHTGSVHGEIGVGYQPIHNIEACITNVFTKATSQEFQSLELKSILFPLMGTGTAQGSLRPLAERLIGAAISCMETNAKSTIEGVYFLTWTDIELETCKEILEDSDRVIPVR